MNAIATIFRKDVRRLWPQIAAFWALLALSVLFDPGRGERGVSPHLSFLIFLSMVKPLACWLLIVAAIHEERLPGDRQYWLSRPFTWRALLLEKALFIACFVNLAVFATQAMTLLSTGIAPAQHLPALLWRQVFFSALFVLPVAAFSSVTRNLGQVVLGALIVFVPFFTLPQFHILMPPPISWDNLEWLRAALPAILMIAGAGAILLLQFSTRRTVLSRAVIGVVVASQILAPVLLPKAIAAIRSQPRPQQVEARVTPSHALPRSDSSGRGVRIAIPVTIANLPDGAEIVPERFTATISSGTNTRVPLIADRFTAPAQLHASLIRSLYDSIKDQPVTLGGTLEFTMVRNRRTLPVPPPNGEIVPGVGLCFPSPIVFLTGPARIGVACATPFPRRAVFLVQNEGRPNWIIPPGSASAPIPTDSGFDLVDRFSSQISYSDAADLRSAQFYTADPVGHLQIPYSFPNLRLADYVVE